MPPRLPCHCSEPSLGNHTAGQCVGAQRDVAIEPQNYCKRGRPPEAKEPECQRAKSHTHLCKRCLLLQCLLVKTRSLGKSPCPPQWELLMGGTRSYYLEIPTVQGHPDTQHLSLFLMAVRWAGLPNTALHAHVNGISPRETCEAETMVLPG